MTNIAHLEHEAFSSEFIAFLRATNDLNHEDCSTCMPPIYESGIVDRAWTRALDCPLCGVQVKRAAVVLVRRDYERHLTAEHFPFDTQSSSRP